MIVVISPESEQVNEHYLIEELFANGLDYFHIRKYHFSDDEMRQYIDLIPPQLRGQLVLHSHFHLAREFNINRFHINKKHRVSQQIIYFPEKFHYSTSVHKIQDYNHLSNFWEYAFFSPVFPSISKENYGVENAVLQDIKHKKDSSILLLGLGGIHHKNYQYLREQGADGGALLGSIWQTPQPLSNFLKCKKIDLLY